MPDHVWNRPQAFVLGARAVFTFHQAAYRATGGLIGHRLGPISCLLLTTRGAKSGLARTLPLVYGRDGDRLVLVASKGGSPKHPAWYVNLKAHPEVVVQVGSKNLWMNARTATVAERPRLWKLMTRQYKGYDGYQERTEREIPLVVLEPSAAGSRKSHRPA
ncbi:MAG TPA: nitroreductase family deazaflavin-dependent oxidoreductase [Candidatus Dormibacteraeota bacterium]|jgi:deazaflavin-dependent oxidoreductase (nitroreductase family)